MLRILLWFANLLPPFIPGAVTMYHRYLPHCVGSYLLVALITLHLSVWQISVAAGEEADRPTPAARPELVKDERFLFREANADVLYALSQFTADCTVHLVFEPAKRDQLQFQFLREGQPVLTIAGHRRSVFCNDGDRLFFAHFSTSTSGCLIAAYDLTTGKPIWETRLRKLATPGHSVYDNLVTMGFSPARNGETETPPTVTIRGHESYGDYQEVLDARTGKSLDYKLYRLGYERGKQ